MNNNNPRTDMTNNFCLHYYYPGAMASVDTIREAIETRLNLVD